MRVGRTPLHLLLMLVAASAFTACAGDDDSTAQQRPPRDAVSSYERDVRDVHDAMNDAMSVAFGSQQLDADLVQAARTTASESVDEMNSMDPPRRYDAAHAEYTRGLALFASILADIHRQVGDPNAARRHLADKRFTTGVAHLERASDLYSEAGFDLDEPAADG